jgi:hypothetical protein
MTWYYSYQKIKIGLFLVILRTQFNFSRIILRTVMKKLFLLLFLVTVGVSTTYAQDPVVIKEEGAERDLDEEPDVRDLTFRERLRFGGGINGGTISSFGINIGVSPMAGYMLTNNTIVGAGLTYNYNSASGYYTLSQLGEKLFIRQNIPFLQQIIGQGYLTGQVENYSELSNTPIQYSNPVLIGIGLGAPKGFGIAIMYDLNYSTTGMKVSPYGSALVVQIGGFFF